MNFIKKFEKYFEEGDYKKQLTNLFIILIISCIILVFISSFNENEGYNQNNDSNSLNVSNENYSSTKFDYSTTLESKLENILSQIKGAGKVKVMVTINDSIERIPAINTNKTQEKTIERDSEGGTREITRDEVSQQVVTENNNSMAIIKEVNPQINGVIVVAEGAEDINVKEKLYNAVKTVLGISGNKVEVYSSK